MAEKFQSKFILLGRTSLASEQPVWAEGQIDEASLKKAVLNWLKDQGIRKKPKEINKMIHEGKLFLEK